MSGNVPSETIASSQPNQGGVGSQGTDTYASMLTKGTALKGARGPFFAACRVRTRPLERARLGHDHAGRAQPPPPCRRLPCAACSVQNEGPRAESASGARVWSFLLRLFRPGHATRPSGPVRLFAALSRVTMAMKQAVWD